MSAAFQEPAIDVYLVEERYLEVHFSLEVVHLLSPYIFTRKIGSIYFVGGETALAGPPNGGFEASVGAGLERKPELCLLSCLFLSSNKKLSVLAVLTVVLYSSWL